MSVHDLVLTPTGLFFAGRRFACTIGRGGLTEHKQEGDGATPIGTHRIVGMFYRPDRIRGAVLPAWAQPIGLRDQWSDDVADPAYNHLVRAPHSFSHEEMRRADPLYDLVMMTDWNWPDAVPGAARLFFCINGGGLAIPRRAAWHLRPQICAGLRRGSIWVRG